MQPIVLPNAQPAIIQATTCAGDSSEQPTSQPTVTTLSQNGVTAAARILGLFGPATIQTAPDALEIFQPVLVLDWQWKVGRRSVGRSDGQTVRRLDGWTVGRLDGWTVIARSGKPET